MTGDDIIDRQSQSRTTEQDVVGFYELESGSEASAFGFDLKVVLNAIRRHLVAVSAIVALAVVVGGVLTMLMTPKYVAGARVLVNQSADEPISGDEYSQSPDGYDASRFLQTQVDVIQGRTLAQRVIENGKLMTDPRFFEAVGMKVEEQAKPEERKKQAVGALLHVRTVNMPSNSNIITISITSRDPAYAAKLADLYAQNYIESNLEQKFDSSAYARQFLTAQLQEARTRLENSERELNRYSRAAGLIRLTGQGSGGQGSQEATLSVNNDSLVQMNTAAGSATAERIAAEDTWKTVAGEPLLNIPQVQANGTVQTLLSQKAELEGKLANERAQHLDDYPSVKKYRAQIAELDRRITSIGTSIKRGIQLDYEAAKAKEATMQANKAELAGNAMSEQDRGVQYNLLKRVADTNRTLYDTLLERYNQLNAEAGAKSNNVTLIDRATVPDVPASPNLLVNLIVSFVLGCLAAAIFVYLREVFDDTIRLPADVERKLDLPLLGIVPLLPEGSDANTELADPRSPMSEAFHSLVVNLRYSTARGFPKVMAVTSSDESEGKSTTAHAIAADIARLGKRTLLIDADLRRPTLHRRLPGAEKAPGLTEALVGDVPVQQLIMASQRQNLDYLTAMPIPPDPALLLSGEGMSRLVKELSAAYDTIVIDCPPILGLSDTTAVARLADGMLFVVNATGFRRGAVKAALRRLKLINANVLGIVLNKFDPKGGESGYDYYGYNYYSYGRENSEQA